MAFHRAPLPRLIYRISWGADPLAYGPLAILKAGRPGRWDDLKYRFRTGYFADSLVTCFVEVLADLRPDPKTVARLCAMGEPLPNMDVAIEESLRPRYASIVITQEDLIVDIVHPISRTEFEVLTHRTNRVKVGDFLARDLRIPRRAAGVAHDRGEAGIRAPSAEALAVNGETFNLFETTVGSGQARVALVPHVVRSAAEQEIDLATARVLLGI